MKWSGFLWQQHLLGPAGGAEQPCPTPELPLSCSCWALVPSPERVGMSDTDGYAANCCTFVFYRASPFLWSGPENWIPINCLKYHGFIKINSRQWRKHLKLQVHWALLWALLKAGDWVKWTLNLKKCNILTCFLISSCLLCLNDLV